MICVTLAPRPSALSHVKFLTCPLYSTLKQKTLRVNLSLSALTINTSNCSPFIKAPALLCFSSETR